MQKRAKIICIKSQQLQFPTTYKATFKWEERKNRVIGTLVQSHQNSRFSDKYFNYFHLPFILLLSRELSLLSGMAP